MIKLFTWKQAEENPHDISGIINPEDYLYYKLSGVYYPQSGTAMKTRFTRYEIPIDEKDFQKINDEGLWNPDGDMLSDRLDALEGVFETDYNGHFGSIVLLSIEGEHDTPELKLKIFETIQEYVKQ